MSDLRRSRSPRPSPLPSQSERLAWLAGLFAAPPDHVAIASYRHGPASALLDDLKADTDFTLPVTRLRAALDSAEEDGEVVARVGRAYGLLFEGVGGPKTVSPYESAYGADGRLFGAPTAEMEAFLAAHDLSVSPSTHEAADHIAIELAVAAELVARGDPDAAAMIGRLSAWVPTFAAACTATDTTGFWAGAALLLAAIVQRDARPAGNAETNDAMSH